MEKWNPEKCVICTMITFWHDVYHCGEAQAGEAWKSGAAYE